VIGPCSIFSRARPQSVLMSVRKSGTAPTGPSRTGLAAESEHQEVLGKTAAQSVAMLTVVHPRRALVTRIGSAAVKVPASLW
jgi:hypothetical protein